MAITPQTSSADDFRLAALWNHGGNKKIIPNEVTEITIITNVRAVSLVWRTDGQKLRHAVTITSGSNQHNTR